MLKYWDGEKYVDVEELSIYENGVWVKCNNIVLKKSFTDDLGIEHIIFNAIGVEDGIERQFELINNYAMA